MKLTSGTLCRDSANALFELVISFFPPLKPTIGDNGAWGWHFDVRDTDNWIGWTLDDWKNEYSLTPPAPGTCFEVDIEL